MTGNSDGALFAKPFNAYGKTYWNRNVQGASAFLIARQMLIFALLWLFVARLWARCSSVAVQRARMWHCVRVVVIDHFMWCDSVASALQMTVMREVDRVGIFHLRVHHGWGRLDDRRRRSCSGSVQVVWCDCIWLVRFILQWHIRNRCEVGADAWMWMQWRWWQNARLVRESLAVHLVFFLRNRLAIGVQHAAVVEAIIVWTDEFAAVKLILIDEGKSSG